MLKPPPPLACDNGLVTPEIVQLAGPGSWSKQDPWSVRLFYGPNSPSPGKLASEIRGNGERAKDDAIREARRRPEIGRIDVLDVRRNLGWACVYLQSS
jgi:hypothetical protein